MCPNENRTKLFIKTTDDMDEWIVKDGKTDSGLVFWIPKYIMMRGTEFLRHGTHVASDKKSSKEPRHYRLEELHGGRNIQRIPLHSECASGARMPQDKWQTMGQTVHT